MRTFFYSLTILFGVLLIGSFIQESYAQGVSQESGFSCNVPENADQIRQDYINLSNSLINDWKIEHVHVGCFESIQTFYILPEFSSDNTTFVVSVYQYDLRHGGEMREDFLKNRNDVVKDAISKLNSNMLFKEISDKFLNKRIAFTYGSEIFDVSVYNESNYYTSTFEINTQRDDLFDFKLIHNVDLESLPMVQEMHKQAENFLMDSNSFCTIEHCFGDLCGETSVYTGTRSDSSGTVPMHYTARIDLEGPSCPPHIQVGLEPDWKLSYVIPIDKKWIKTVLPSEWDSPLKQFSKGILYSDVKCKTGLELMKKSLDGSPACVRHETAIKLSERGWGFYINSKEKPNSLELCNSIFEDWKQTIEQFEESNNQSVELISIYEKYYKKYVENDCDVSRIHDY